MTADTRGLLTKVMVGVVTAVALSAGGGLIASAKTNAVQDVRLDNIESLLGEQKELNANLQRTNLEVALLRQELEASRRDTRN